MNVPKLVSWVAIPLGCLDLFRGMAHTVFLGAVGADKSGLDFTNFGGPEQAVLMAAFGASNLLTGVALIAAGLLSRAMALVVLTAVPFAYGVTGLSLEYWIGGLDATAGRWEGAQMMAVYINICLATVVYAWWHVVFGGPKKLEFG